MKQLLIFTLLVLKTPMSFGATQPPPDPPSNFRFNWVELESEPVPLCSNISFRQCIGTSSERCDAAARDQIRAINKEIKELTAGRNLSNNEVADYRNYIVGQFLHRLRLRLANRNANAFMRCFSH